MIYFFITILLLLLTLFWFAPKSIRLPSNVDELTKLKTPTLVIHGKNNPLVLFENAEKYAPMIPNVKTLYIDDLKHHFSEKYTAEITATILKHLKTTILKCTKKTFLKIK